MDEQASQRLLVKASPERCYEVATDFESYPKWSSDITKAAVLARDDVGRPLNVRFGAEALGRTTEFELRYDYADAPGRVSWTLVKGDIERRLDGEYRFEAAAGGTELSYRLQVELCVPMPGFVKRRAEKRIFGAALQELRTRAES